MSGEATAMRGNAPAELGDFTTTWRVLPLTLVAIVVGLVGAGLALALMRLIGMFTNLFYYQRLRFDLVSPAGHHLGYWSVLVPVVGGLLIGLMARFGSEKIRGHGIPEAIEAILLGDSLIHPRVALLKPLSSAISIGSGGPFGAEGPIIMTGGAFGSLVGQFIHLSPAERKTLLVAGAAAGMSATFATPVAAVLLAVELLLFEWRPRSLIPVAAAATVAAFARFSLLGPGPLFPTPLHAVPSALGLAGFLACIFVGLSAGMLSGLLTIFVYGVEDGFLRLPIHWMWWPALGGLVVGTGGLFFPRALGVGYDLIGNLLNGQVAPALLFGILVVKSIIWVVALGSGTSGGVLAPLLMMGAALGGLESHILPNEGAGFWALIAMGAILGGTMRAPFTAVVFCLELTHDFNALLPLMVAVIAAECFTVLVLKRSILTERLARRGHHLTREYGVDPLEMLAVEQVYARNCAQVAIGTEPARWQDALAAYPDALHFCAVDTHGRLVGMVTREAVVAAAAHPGPDAPLPEVLPVPVAHPHEPLRVVVLRMAESNQLSLPVVSHGDEQLVGLVTLADMLKARSHQWGQENRRIRARTSGVRRLTRAVLAAHSGRKETETTDVAPRS